MGQTLNQKARRIEWGKLTSEIKFNCGCKAIRLHDIYGINHFCEKHNPFKEG